jgi:magnesium transporter
MPDATVRVHDDGHLALMTQPVSNRQDLVMKQLTIISTIFLPLTFITGFFGQNFAWMIEHVTGWPAFAGLAIGLELAAIALVVVLFKRRGCF